MTMLLPIGLIIFILLYIPSKGKYSEYVEPLDKKEYILKDLLPMGFFVMEKLRYKYRSAYDKRLRLRTSELNGAKYSEFYLWVHWANKMASIAVVFLLMCLVGAGWGEFDPAYPVIVVAVLVGTFIGLDKELESKIDKRKISMQCDFPDFINKLTLLLNAGMTVSKAWERIVEENKKDSPFYREAAFAIAEVKNGTTEAAAFEDFARRCRVVEITKFISILLQNLRKGSSEMVITLQLMSKDCWEMRKHVARRLGEEASTKLLFPMIFNFFVVIIIVAMPAIIEMQQVGK